jgi:hypothetical protein
MRKSVGGREGAEERVLRPVCCAVLTFIMRGGHCGCPVAVTMDAAGDNNARGARQKEVAERAWTRVRVAPRGGASVRRAAPHPAECRLDVLTISGHHSPARRTQVVEPQGPPDPACVHAPRG